MDKNLIFVSNQMSESKYIDKFRNISNVYDGTSY